jgi:hypothetical protein
MFNSLVLLLITTRSSERKTRRAELPRRADRGRRAVRGGDIDLERELLLVLHLDANITAEQFRAKSAELEGVRVAVEGQRLPEKNQIYKMRRLHVPAHRDGTLIADWECNVLALTRWSSAVATPAFRFRALLTKGGAGQVELVRA